MLSFIWDQRNVAHIAGHGVFPETAERVVLNARHPYPMKHDSTKWIVRGRDSNGRMTQVVFVRLVDAHGVDWSSANIAEAEDSDAIYVIHAMPMSDEQKRREKRRRS